MATITILLADWNAFKECIYVVAPTILKVCAFEGPSMEPPP